MRQGESRKRRAAEAATPVTVETAVRGAIDHMVTADAVLYPVNQANVTSKISAPVKRVLVNRGDHVRAGQIARGTRKRRSGRGRQREQEPVRTVAGRISNHYRRHRSRRQDQSRSRCAEPRSKCSTPPRSYTTIASLCRRKERWRRSWSMTPRSRWCRRRASSKRRSAIWKR